MAKSLTLQKITFWLKKYSLVEYLAGLWFSRKFDKSGILALTERRPWPQVINKGGTLTAGNCQFYSGVRLEIGANARLQIGNGTYLNRNALIVCENRVTLGKNCKIAWDVVIMDTDLHPVNSKPIINKPVTIEDEVWVGCRSIILKGVTIGRGAVIAAGAVVTKDIPPYTMWGGAPARYITDVEDR